MRGEQNDTVQRILRSNEWLMSVLHAARAVDLPDWFVGAGAIRNTVWDYLHGYTMPTPLADVDVVFFDPQDLTPARDAAAETHLCTRACPASPGKRKTKPPSISGTRRCSATRSSRRHRAKTPLAHGRKQRRASASACSRMTPCLSRPRMGWTIFCTWSCGTTRGVRRSRCSASASRAKGLPRSGHVSR